MFVVSDADAAAIRGPVFQQRGELSATVELRRLFPGLDAETGALVHADNRRLGTTVRAAAMPGETASRQRAGESAAVTALGPRPPPSGQTSAPLD
jgi:hypothetical protein